MKTIELSTDLSSWIPEIVDVLSSHGLVLLPTDTTYALACNALSEEGIKRIFHFKGRPASQPLPAAVCDLGMADCYVTVTEKARGLARAFWPGPLTLVLNHRQNVPRELVAGGSTLGVRVPRYAPVTEIVRCLGAPVTITSANISGMPSAYSVDDFLQQANLSKVQCCVSLIVDAGTLPFVPASTLVDCTGDTPKILREGSIPMSSIEKVLNRSEAYGQFSGVGP